LDQRSLLHSFSCILVVSFLLRCSLACGNHPKFCRMKDISHYEMSKAANFLEMFSTFFSISTSSSLLKLVILFSYVRYKNVLDPILLSMKTFLAMLVNSNDKEDTCCSGTRGTKYDRVGPFCAQRIY
jgi:hypothetical protein